MDIYSILQKEHQELKGLLDELIHLDESDSYRDVLIEQIKNELVHHSRAEESVFYNSIRAVGSDKSDVMHSFKEHMEAEGLVRVLQAKEKVNLEWKPLAIKIKDAIEHHISEEEGRVFNEARSIFSDDEANMMGDAFIKLKEEFKQHGFAKNSLDLIINLMPPRFINQLKGFNS